MTGMHQNPDERELDGALDRALAKYASVEPRAGLEERILANVRIERAAAVPVWWKWEVVLAVAAAIVVGIAFAWRPEKPAAPIANHAVVTGEQTSPPQQASRESLTKRPERVRVRPVRVRSSLQNAVAPESPKLDQFPSPQPLTEEELALVRYVRQFPKDARMIALAQEESEKELQREGIPGRGGNSSDFERQER